MPLDTGVAIIAPGGYAPDETTVARAIAYLESQGCRVFNYYHSAEKFQRFGGSDAARLQQLEAAAANPDVRVVLALRGGYGLSRLLTQIDFHKLAASGKLFVGQSDLTPLHMGLLKEGAASFAGPMICDDFGAEERNAYGMEQFWQCLRGPAHTVKADADGNPAVEVFGKLWGGNLAMLAHLSGTPYMPEVEGGILFLEDIAEHPFRVERMLLQLLYSGVLAQQKAVLLGQFTNYRLSDYDNGYDFEAMLSYIRSVCPIPVLTGLPFGHVREKTTLAVGSNAHLESDGTRWQLTMRDYPTLGTLAA